MIGEFQKAKDPYLPMRTDGCNKNEGSETFMQNHQYTNASSTVNQNLDLPWIFRLNFQYHTFIGLFFNICISLLVSYFTGGEKALDQRLLATFLRKKPPQELLMKGSDCRTKT